MMTDETRPRDAADLDGFEADLDRWGSDMAAWPPEARTRGRALLTQSAQARALLSQQQSLDHAVTELGDHVVPAGRSQTHLVHRLCQCIQFPPLSQVIAASRALPCLGRQLKFAHWAIHGDPPFDRDGGTSNSTFTTSCAFWSQTNRHPSASMAMSPPSPDGPTKSVSENDRACLERRKHLPFHTVCKVSSVDEAKGDR